MSCLSSEITLTVLLPITAHAKVSNAVCTENMWCFEILGSHSDYYHVVEVLGFGTVCIFRSMPTHLVGDG
jgi:hypothetical protein